MAEKVFISYSHQDGPCAHGIARYLARHGCDVWIDTQNLALGERWASDIEMQARHAGVPVFMKASLRWIMDVELRREFPWGKA